MCIIVAKKAGIEMPGKEIISNCFTHNPDGAGIMLAYKGEVYGFKGLMTLEAFNDKLHRLEKRFGSLKRLSVVMHFRITTHGGTAPENTHPFPLKSSYAALRDLEWVAPQGMAHNGIIEATGYHPDIKAEKVSDTMAFIRYIAAPMAKLTNIAGSADIAKALQLAAGSKLAFLDGKGRLRCEGDFTQEGGIFYSNSSYKEARIAYRRYTSLYDYGWDDVAWDPQTMRYVPKSQDVDDYDDFDEEAFRDELAENMNLMQLDENVYIDELNGRPYEADGEFAVSMDDGSLYYYSYRHEAWMSYLREDQYRLLDAQGSEVWPNA